MVTTDISLSHNFKPASPTKKIYQLVAMTLEFYTNHDESQRNIPTSEKKKKTDVNLPMNHFIQIFIKKTIYSLQDVTA